jgi:hypothetical protein
MNKRVPFRPKYVTVFRTYYTDRKGKRIYAKHYGYKAWPIRVRIK